MLNHIPLQGPVGVREKAKSCVHSPSRRLATSEAAQRRRRGEQQPFPGAYSSGVVWSTPVHLRIEWKGKTVNEAHRS